MPRAMSPEMLAALSSSQITPAIFAQLTFASTTICVWSGIGDISWNTLTWTGLGSLLSLSPMEDGATVEARGISVVLSGLDPALLADCNSDYKLGLPARVYLGIMSGGAPIADPLTTWAGKMDQPTVDVSAEEATITINLENLLISMNNAVDRRLTNQDQQMTWPGDLGLQFVDAIQEMTMFWGAQANNTNNI